MGRLTDDTGVATERHHRLGKGKAALARGGRRERVEDGEGEDGNGGDRVGGGACQEQTTAAILHVNGISKRMIRAPRRSERAIIDNGSMMFDSRHRARIKLRL